MFIIQRIKANKNFLIVKIDFQIIFNLKVNLKIKIKKSKKEEDIKYAHLIRN